MWGAGYILVSCAHSNTSFMWNIHNVNEFRGVRVTRSLVFCVCFVDGCLSFCNFFLAIVWSVLQYTDSEYSFGIFKQSIVSCVPAERRMLFGHVRQSPFNNQ